MFDWIHTVSSSESQSGQRYTTVSDWIESCVPRDLSTIERNAVRRSSDPHEGHLGVRSRSHFISQVSQITVTFSVFLDSFESPLRFSSSPQFGQTISCMLTIK